MICIFNTYYDLAYQFLTILPDDRLEYNQLMRKRLSKDNIQAVRGCQKAY